MKLCRACNCEKKLSAFYADRSKSDGRAAQCKACVIARSRAWYANNKERAKLWSIGYRQTHKKQIATRLRQWYKNNKQKHLANCKIWRESNKAYTKEQNVLYRGHKRQAMPKWANRFFMREAYHLAALRTAMLGTKWEVDHIVPLRSEIVCGLHCHTNLRVIPKQENRDKGNKYWPHMPGGGVRA